MCTPMSTMWPGAQAEALPAALRGGDQVGDALPEDTLSHHAVERVVPHEQAGQLLPLVRGDEVAGVAARGQRAGGGEGFQDGSHVCSLRGGPRGIGGADSRRAAVRSEQWSTLKLCKRFADTAHAIDAVCGDRYRR